MTRVPTDYPQVSSIRPHKARPLASCLLAGVAVVALSGCAALNDPYVDMGTEVDYRPSHENAVTFARSKAKELTDRRDQLERYEVSTGALALGSGIAGLAFAAFGAHSDAILGAGLVGGSAYGAGAFMPSQKRKTIYTNGAKAIECAIKATSIGLEDRVEPEESKQDDADAQASESTARSAATARGSQGSARSLDAYLNRLRELTGEDKTARARIETAPLSPLAAAPRIETTARSSRAVVRQAVIFDKQSARADLSLSEARSALVELTASVNALMLDRGTRLMGALSDVLAAVSDQLDATRVDPDAALKAMREGSFAVVEKSKKTNEQLQNATADAQEASVEGNLALAEAQSENSALDGADSAAAAMEAKAEEARIISTTAANVLEIVQDQTNCLRELSGDDDDSSEN